LRIRLKKELYVVPFQESF